MVTCGRKRILTENWGDKNIGRDQGKLPRATQLGLTEDTFHGDPHDQYHKILYDGNSSDGNISHNIVLRKMVSVGSRTNSTYFLYHMLRRKRVNLGQQTWESKMFAIGLTVDKLDIFVATQNEISTCLRPGAGKLC